MNYDMDAFLNDLRDSQQQEPSYTMALFHHLWKDHPLKIEPVITVIALSDNLAFDLADVQYIRREHFDYVIGFKSDETSITVPENSSEYMKLQRLMQVLGNRFLKPDEH